MNVLLVALNAKYIHSNPALFSLRAYAGCFCDVSGIHIAEYTINQRTDYILADLYKREPDVIAFSCYIWNIEMIHEIITEYHKLKPNVPIFVGGPEVTYDAPKVLDLHPAITGVMIGEGEATFAKLYQRLLDGVMNFSNIAGLMIRDEAYQEREALDLDQLPFLYSETEEFTNRIIYYESSRGCPFNCSYCLSCVDKRVRYRNIDIVKEELQFFLRQNVKQVKFVDRTFNCDRKRAYELWEFLRNNDNGITNFHFEIAADLITDEQIQLLSTLRKGLIQLEIGVQTTNEDTLREIDRPLSIGHIKDVSMRLLAAQNIHIHLDLIAGLPNENLTSFKKSFNDVYKMQPHQLQLGFLKILKGSPMEQRAKGYDCVYHDKAPYEVLSTKWLGYDEILELKGVEEMLEVYYNSGQFTTTMQIALGFFASPYEMYHELAAFYERRKFSVMTPSRIGRYEVFLEFVDTLENIDREKIREALIYDLYLRENLKSRPSFAGDCSVHKERNAMSHYEAFHYEFQMTNSDYLETPVVLCFDYSKRDPISNSVSVSQVTEE